MITRVFSISNIHFRISKKVKFTNIPGFLSGAFGNCHWTLLLVVCLQIIPVKKTVLLVLLLGFLSALCGYLLSKASLAGRVGISVFYKKYHFLKVWWQGALVIFIVLISLLLIQGWAEQKLLKRKANNLHIATIVLAAAGLFFTWYDFRHTTTHRLLGERFHIGAYLFWIGWMIVSLFYLTQQKKEIAEP